MPCYNVKVDLIRDGKIIETELFAEAINSSQADEYRRKAEKEYGDDLVNVWLEPTYKF